MYYSIIYERIQVDISHIFIKRCAKCYARFWFWRKISLSFQKNPNSALLHFAKPETWLKSTLHADLSQASLIFWIFMQYNAILSQRKIYSYRLHFTSGFFTPYLPYWAKARYFPQLMPWFWIYQKDFCYLSQIYSCRIKQHPLAAFSRS